MMIKEKEKRGVKNVRAFQGDSHVQVNFCKGVVRVRDVEFFAAGSF